MTITKTSNFLFDCPYTNKKQSITIKYVKHHTDLEYKKNAYGCDLKHDCPYPEEDAYGLCPVYKEAPKYIH